MPTKTAERELRYTIHTGNGRVLETLVPLARAVEIVGQFAMPEQRRRRELETIKLRAGEITTVEGIVVRCFAAEPATAQHPDTDRFVISREQLEELLADRTLHLAESKQLAILRRFEDRQHVRAGGFDFTGMLLVRLHAGGPEEARELLAAAAHAALESSEWVAGVEGTNVTHRSGAAS